MPEWLTSLDPLVQKLVLAGAAVVALAVVATVWQRWRERATAVRRRAEVRRTLEAVEIKQREVEQFAQQIIATSSTAKIAGFLLVRQIEAVFAEGQRSPAEAVDLLKALAARKGANALINLASQRLPS